MSTQCSIIYHHLLIFNDVSVVLDFTCVILCGLTDVFDSVMFDLQAQVAKTDAEKALNSVSEVAGEEVSGSSTVSAADWLTWQLRHTNLASCPFHLIPFHKFSQ